MTPPLTLEQWLTAATRELAKSSEEQVRAEITEHYEAARDAALESGATYEAAHAASMDALGDCRAAHRAYRRVLPTKWEMIWVGQSEPLPPDHDPHHWASRLSVVCFAICLLIAFAAFVTDFTVTRMLSIVASCLVFCRVISTRWVTKWVTPVVAIGLVGATIWAWFRNDLSHAREFAGAALAVCYAWTLFLARPRTNHPRLWDYALRWVTIGVVIFSISILERYSPTEELVWLMVVVLFLESVKVSLRRKLPRDRWPKGLA